MDCPDLETLCVKDQALTTESMPFELGLLLDFYAVTFSVILIGAIIFPLIVIMKGVEKIVGWALSYQFMNHSEVSVKDAKLGISAERYSLNSFQLLLSLF